MPDRAIRYDFIGRDRSASRTADRVARRFDGLSSRVAVFSRVGSRSFGLVATGLGAVGVAAATMGIKTAAGLEQADIAFETLLGSGERAERFLDDLKQFAAKTPFELPGLISASRQLIGVGQSAKSVIPTLRAWGDAAGALGLSQEQFERAMLAVTQAMSKGKVQSEELLQITEAGIPIWPLLSKAMGKSVPELQKLASEGKLLAKDVFPALEKQMAKDYGGAMAKQSRTLTGLWSTFMDTINIGLADAIKPFENELKGGLREATKIAGKGLGKLPGFIDDLKTSIEGLNLDDLAGKLRDTGSSILDAARAWASDVIAGLTEGLETGNWSDFATTLGRKIGELTLGLPKHLFTALREIDWLEAGKQAAIIAVPFALGFIGGLLDGVIESFRQDFWRSLFAVLSIVPIGRAAGVLGRIFGKLPIVGPLLSAIQKVGRLVERPIAAVVGFIGRNFIKGFAQHFPGVAGKFRGWLLLLDTAIRSKAIDIARAARRVVEGFVAGIGSAVGLVVRSIGRFIGFITRPFARAGGWLVRRGVDIVLGLVRGLGSMLAAVGRATAGLIGRLLAPFARAGGWLVSRGREAVLGLTRGIVAMLATTGGAAGRIVAAVTGRFRGAASWLVNAGKDVLRGLVSGFRSIDVRKVLGDIVGGAVNWVKRILGIRSPSTVFAGIGRNVVLGLLRGIRDNAGNLFGDLVAKIDPGILGRALQGVTRFGAGLLKKLGGAFGSLFGRIGSAPGNVTQWAAQAAAIAGVGPSWIPALVRRAMFESGGNPRAINLWDVNARRGDPSKGIMQTISATFGRFALPGLGNIWDPVHNMVAAIRYIRARYGSIFAIDPPVRGYRSGAWEILRDEVAMVHRGEMVVPSGPAERIRQGARDAVIDYDRLGAALARHLHGARVELDGRQVGELVVRPMVRELHRMVKPGAARA